MSRVLCCRSEFEGGQGARQSGADVLEELRDDWEAADTDTNGELGVGPQAHGDYIVAYIG